MWDSPSSRFRAIPAQGSTPITLQFSLSARSISFSLEQENTGGAKRDTDLHWRQAVRRDDVDGPACESGGVDVIWMKEDPLG